MKKQNNAKKVNKPLSKKVAPFVMSTTMMAATFLAAGAPISAAELEGKNVNHEVIEQAKNHGQKVSALAKSLPGSPEKGQLVSELAKSKSENIIEESANEDVTEVEGVEEGAEAPAEPVEEGEADEDVTETEEVVEGTEAPAEPVAEEGEADEDVTETEEVVEEGTEAPAEPAEEVEADEDVTETEESVEEGTEMPAEPEAEEGEVSEDVTETEEVVEGTEAPAETSADTETSSEIAPVDETTVEIENQEDGNVSPDTWLDNTYQVIGTNYQSLIGYYQKLIDQYFGQTGSEQTNDDEQQTDSEPTNDDYESVNVDLSEVSADAEAVDHLTDVESDIEDNSELATTVDNTEVEEVNNSAEMGEGQDDLGESQSEVPVDVELEGNLEQPELTEDEISSDDETELVNQNDQDLNQQEEVEKDPSDKNSIKDKLIGYYQDLVASFSNFMSFLK